MKEKTIKISLVILLSIVCMELDAQIVIREKVKISDSKLKDRINFSQLENINWWPCTPPPKSSDYYNPHQVVWQGSIFPLKPSLQDLRSDYSYGIDKNKMYTIRILSGNSHCYFQRNQWSPDYGEPEIIRNEITLSGRDMYAKTMTDTGLAIIDYCERVLDRDGAPFYAFNYWFEYTLHFGTIDISETEVIYSVQGLGDSTVYVHSYIKKPNYDLTYSVGKDTILYREKNEITIGASSVECFNTASYMIPRNGGSIADDVSCTFRIQQGAEYCTIKCSDPFITGDEITIPYGVAKNGITLITNDDLNPADDEEVIIEYNCPEPFVRNHVMHISFVIKHNPYPPPGIIFVFNKNHIAKGDSTLFSLKRRTVDGQIVDFPTDQKFNISVYDGSDYGSLYSIEHDSYNNSMEEVPNGFKFYSYPDIEHASATVTFRATTLISSSNSSVIANNLKEKMMPAGLNMLFIGGGEEQLEGYGELTIGEPANADTFYVKASFDKQNFSAGDILNVGFVKVDKNGNESSFPAGTLYEVRVDEGCTVGELLISGERGSYFKDVSMPLQFIVNDSLETADSVISVKVGVPGDDGTVYLNYTNASTGTAIAGVNYKMLGKVKSVANATSACSGSSFVYTVNANAVTNAGGEDCNEPENQCTTSEEPKAPEIKIVRMPYDELCSPSRINDGIYGATFFNGRANDQEIFGFDYGAFGSLQPIDASFEIKACYNKSRNQWIITAGETNMFKLRYQTGWCENKLEHDGYFPINNIDAAKQIANTLTESQLCDFIDDFLNQSNYKYYNGQMGKNVLTEIISAHEMKHSLDLEGIINRLKISNNLKSQFNKVIMKNCDQISSKNTLISKAKKDYLKILAQIIETVRKESNNYFGRGLGDPKTSQIDQKAQTVAFDKYGWKYVNEFIKIGVQKGYDKVSKYAALYPNKNKN